jgi:5'-nucleotidase
MEELKSSSRRSFIKTLSASAALLAIGANPLAAAAKERITKLTILHTNDVHSRIEPFPEDGSRNAGLGGVARRASLIKQIRAEEEQVLLLDAGDIFQGTPYFNLYGGEIEIKLMSKLGYDAATMGNHDFDAGIDGFEKQLKHANFPFLIANYDFSGTVLEGKTQPFKVFHKGALKIGVFGLGIALEGLVEVSNYGQVKYLDPIPVANQIANQLKQEQQCDLVICLSHLGYSYKDNKVSDKVLADQTSGIDLIIGAHTHTFMTAPEIRKNKQGEEVRIFQVGFAGINLGRIDYYFEKGRKKKQAIGLAMRIDQQLTDDFEIA